MMRLKIKQVSRYPVDRNTPPCSILSKPTQGQLVSFKGKVVNKRFNDTC